MLVFAFILLQSNLNRKRHFVTHHNSTKKGNRNTLSEVNQFDFKLLQPHQFICVYFSRCVFCTLEILECNPFPSVCVYCILADDFLMTMILFPEFAKHALC